MKTKEKIVKSALISIAKVEQSKVISYTEVAENSFSVILSNSYVIAFCIYKSGDNYNWDYEE